MSEERWTLDELNGEVRGALAVDYVPATSARVRAVPDRRTIRYYTTLGLIDRAAEMRGRTAYYSERHLRQLVAVKRLQAEGLTLNQIQERLAGLDDAALAAIAQLPAPPRAPRGRRAASPRPAFWQDAPALAPAPEPAPAPDARTSQLTGLALADGVSLLLQGAHALDASDRLDVLEAAGPLLQVLKSKGIIPE